MLEVMDTTLRDGEQMKDVSYTASEKLTMAKMLINDLNIHRVELTSARVSEGEKKSLSQIMDWAKEHGYTERFEILGFTDHDASVDWILGVGCKVMNLLTKGSLKHVQLQLKKTKEEHLADILKTVEYADKKGVSVNIYLEDWSSGMIDSIDYVHFMIDNLKDTSIKRFMLPDTLGILNPYQVEKFCSDLIKKYPGLHFDFHGHNDYGLATANTLASVKAGVHGIHCTINGMGERTGNTPLDETVVGIKDFFDIDTGINEKKLFNLSETVEIFSGKRIAFNKPVSGANVFTQTAGIHADGDNKANLYANRLLPERFGRKRQYALGKLSGKSSLEYNLKDLGIDLSNEDKKKVLKKIIELGDKKETITQEDLPYIISDVLELQEDRAFILKSCIIVSSMGMKSMATVVIDYKKKGESEYNEFEGIGSGDGGYDSLMNAISEVTMQLGFELPQLLDYQVTIPPGGKTDALVQCSITWRNSRTFVTKGVHSDQVLAAAEATEKMLNMEF